MIKNQQKGFTLIELLVVIAIIGVLASVILAALNSARSKGSNAAVKANLANARAGAELFYDAGQTYTGVCAASGTNVIGPQVLAAAKASSSTAAVTINGTGTVTGAGTSTGQATCNTNGTAWAAESPLKATESGNTMWCSDSTGASKGESTSIGATYVCP